MNREFTLCAHLLPTAELLSRSHSRCGNNGIKVLQLATDARARRKLYVHVMSMLRRFLKSYSAKTVTAAPCSFFKKNGPMMPPYQNPHQTVTRCGCIGFSIMTFGFSEPRIRQFCLLTLLTFCPNNLKCTEKLG